MAQINGYKEELQEELQKADPNSHASRLLTQEIERLEKGDDRKDSRSVAFIDVHPNQPQNAGLKVRIPIREFPRFNFVGKLLGPKGNTLKRLQEETGCKMAILGKGSMRDKTKEEEMRKEGGKKYAHLNDELHVYVEAQAEMTDAYRRLAHAVSELKKFLVPDANDDIRQQQLQEMMYLGGDDARGGRGGFRGGRGGPAGRDVNSGGPAPGRGARGGVAPRGAPTRGGAAPMRGGASRGRGGGGAPPPAQSSSYDDYGYNSSGYGGSSYGGASQRGGGSSAAYDDGYDRRGYGESSYGNDQSDGQYYGSSGYGSGAQSSAASYDDYGSFGDYGDGYGSGPGPMKSSSRGGAKPRSHPYGGSRAAY
ncbi:KH domain-containing, RNA-binding, signal transduction-associated protein 2-like isoform X1 [Babylonia areolata]|uniref:KH domain-containing, RNA-binding, signal transduction-associated protein 2-like isoform X1 n=1 Tax=Babylonia areolata TaxID=304850 RepID=UPI003FD1D75F